MSDEGRSDQQRRVEERVQYVGPFEHHDVLIEGRAVPFLRATPVDGGRVDVTLDRRLGLLLTVAEAERFLPFLADAMAIAMGYAAFPAEGREAVSRPDFPSVTSLYMGPET